MAMTHRLNSALRYLQDNLAPPGDHADGELLARFVAARDEASFAVLVRRHGPMVLGVCRRVLGHLQDAEDAFQATFLVLARKAARVRPEALGTFLYAVAYRTALEARGVIARRRAREKQVEDMPHPQVPPAEPQDWRQVLDRELGRLPEKYRRLVVLCDLAERPRKEVAQELGLAEGTLSSRLAAARQMLARRLSRCGLALSGPALAAALSEQASAALPIPLLDSTTKAAVLVASGQTAALTTPAAVLMQGVLKAMFLKKLTWILVPVLVALLLGAGGLAYRASGQGEPAAPSLEDVLRQLAQVSKQRADLEKQEQKLLTVLEAEAEKQSSARATAVASEREGKLLFIGTEVKAGEGWPESQLVKPEPLVGFLTTQAKPGDPDTFTVPGKPASYRRWQEGENPEPDKCVVARQHQKVRKLRVGDKVERGQLVALVSPSLALTRLAGAVAKLDTAEAERAAATKVKDAAQAIERHMRDANSRVPGAVSQHDLLRAHLDYEKALSEERVKQTAVRTAQADCEEAATLLLMHEVRSPTAGVITAIDRRAGEMVKPGDAVLYVREP
jgi:RNA polymerase sigma factor (sigma-70 family)